jgi:hydroxypyruvate isomerase
MSGRIRGNRPTASRGITRRQALSGVGAAAAAAALGGAAAAQAPDAEWKVEKGRIKQSVCHWCFQPMSVEQLAEASARLGLQSVELVDPKHWPMLKQLGLVCAITSSHGFAKGFANLDQHEECLASLRQAIDATAAAGFPNVITFSGITPPALTKDEGLKHTVAGLKRIIGYAEQKRVNLCLEMLNTRVDEEMKGHPGYLADDVEWVIEVCNEIGSPRMKLLFDIYHVQIMQGDVIRRIRQYGEFIGHVHTAGNPGRHEIEDDQEINYPGVMKALVEVGYQGYVGQEFIPKSADKIAALRRAARLCDV